MFYGAHGESQGGIYGTITKGAYSVVVSKAYGGLDNDQGDTIWYSGSGAKENRDPQNVRKRTKGAKALYQNIKTGKPVRVLRSSYESKIKISRYAPRVGFRYDGLYRVELVTTSINSHGGRYEQFKLVRCKDRAQPSLESLQSIPSLEQENDFKKIHAGF
ncbi:E3 ubiquitin-protein ligase ORTHRUS 2 [Colletotrichum siamense]|nr:E3 ubiquitin-protein ligase ORTHRUS 2 [Colletotrichum siamense]KAF4864927.1 E3 ubiquitin-protein ligase ORTHRUS 2 [Colletotrichum siamense]